MVVYNFNLVSICLAPPKADSPPVVNANAVLTLAVSRELLKVISGGCSQVIQPLRSIQQCKFSLSYPLQIRGKSPRELA
jgi:hypothetical protein